MKDRDSEGGVYSPSKGSWGGNDLSIRVVLINYRIKRHRGKIFPELRNAQLLCMVSCTAKKNDSDSTVQHRIQVPDNQRSTKSGVPKLGNSNLLSLVFSQSLSTNNFVDSDVSFYCAVYTLFAVSVITDFE